MPLDNLLRPPSPETPTSRLTDPHPSCSAKARGPQECAKRGTERNTLDPTMAVSCDVRSEGLQEPRDPQEGREAWDPVEAPPCVESDASMADHDRRDALEAREGLEGLPETGGAAFPLIWPGEDGEEADDHAQDAASQDDIIRLVPRYLDCNVAVLESGELQYVHALNPPSRRERAVVEPIGPEIINRDLRIKLRTDGLEDVSASLLRDLVDAWIEQKLKDHQRALWDRIDQKLTDEQRAYALAELEKVCEARLDEDPLYAATIICEIIYQLKRKRLNLKVEHNLVLYLWSPYRGSGKSEFSDVLGRVCKG